MGRQLGDDLEEMLKAVDDAQWLDTTWQPRSILTLFNDEAVRDAFVNLDVTAMRTKFLSHEWAPCGEYLIASIPAEGEIEEDADKGKTFSCDILMQPSSDPMGPSPLGAEETHHPMGPSPPG